LKNNQTTFAGTAQVLADHGYRPFPGRQATKVPAMKGWPTLNRTPWDRAALLRTVARYRPAEDYCCCLAIQAELVVIDCDILDKALADAAQALADDILGPTPLMRIGLAPKRVLFFRSAGGIRSRKLHPLEIFSGSGQIVAYGWHPKAGRPYSWPFKSPLDIRADSADIPQITQSKLDDFLNEVFKVVPRRSGPPRHLVQFGVSRRPQTIHDRLHTLTLLENSWVKAAAIVLAEAEEGYRNDTGWEVVASAAAHGISEKVVLDLFEQHFTGWEAFGRAELASAIVRARAFQQTHSRRLIAKQGR